jgi:predicted PurR-regulated permease PerM
MPAEKARRGLFTLAAIVVVLAGLRAAQDIVVPIFLALFLAFSSSPLVFRLHRRLPYWLSVSLVLLLELALLVGIGALVGSSADSFQARLPVYRARLEDLYGVAAAWLESRSIPVRADALSEVLDPGSLVDLAGTTASSLGSMVTNLVLVILVLSFTLFEALRIWQKIEQHFAGGRAGDHVLGSISREINRYLGVKTITSAITGLLLGIWCGAFSVDFAVMWGLLAFLLNYVPNIGSILAAIPPILIALVMQGPGVAVAVGAGFLVVNMLIGNIIEPRVMGGVLNLSPVVVLLSILMWGFVLGPVGALLSVPMTMLVKISLSNNDDWAWLADLMSGPKKERPRVPPPSE